MDSTTKVLFMLQYCNGLTWKDQYHLLKCFPDLKEIPHLTSSQFSFVTGRTEKHSDLILSQFHSLSFHKLYSSLIHSNTRFIPIYDQRYPESLKALPQPPWSLFAKGEIQLLKERKLAVVGARKGDHYGKKALQTIIPPLVQHRIVIISGLAKGIDAFSHEETLKANGKTVAVIAGGFDHVYPKENIQLANHIAEKGLILTEYAPDRKPEKWQFPARNRVISGLAHAVLVVQAAKKSGSLITASFAIEQGIEVFAIPGQITHPLSAGVHELIADGAKLVHSAQDILAEFPGI